MKENETEDEHEEEENESNEPHEVTMEVEENEEAGRTFHLNRPFHFVMYDRRRDLKLYCGKVMDPSKN